MASDPRPIKLRLDYVFHYASFILFITWAGIVLKARIFDLTDSEQMRGTVNVIPLVSDSSRHPTQHPFAAASFALALYQVWFANFILLAVAFGRDTDKVKAAYISFALVTVSALFLGLSICVFVDSHVHYAFATIGCSFALIWMGWLSFRPPFPEKAFVARGCWISTIVAIAAVVFGITGFFIDVSNMTALGEYIVFTAVSVLLSLIAIGGRGTQVLLQVTTVPPLKQCEPRETEPQGLDNVSETTEATESPV